MKYINVYLRLIKNKNNYNIYLFNKSFNILMILTFNYYTYLQTSNKLIIKLIKPFLLENGFKCLLLDNWYEFGLKYNLILKLIK